MAEYSGGAQLSAASRAPRGDHSRDELGRCCASVAPDAAELHLRISGLAAGQSSSALRFGEDLSGADSDVFAAGRPHDAYSRSWLAHRGSLVLRWRRCCGQICLVSMGLYIY